MLTIGRALMASPRALLLDGPLVGLTTHAEIWAAAIIERLKEQQVAVLLSERDFTRVRETADRARGLRGGRVVFSGSATSPRHATTFGEICG